MSNLTTFRSEKSEGAFTLDPDLNARWYQHIELHVWVHPGAFTLVSYSDPPPCLMSVSAEVTSK